MPTKPASTRNGMRTGRRAGARGIGVLICLWFLKRLGERPMLHGASCSQCAIDFRSLPILEVDVPGQECLDLLDGLRGWQLGEQATQVRIRLKFVGARGLHQAVCADRGFLGSSAGFGPSQLWHPYATSDEGHADLPTDKESEGCLTSPRSYQIGEQH
jgi:hypothetical protein